MRNRRQFIQAALVVSGVLTVRGALKGATEPDSEVANAWEQVPNILKRTVPPTFADRDFDIADFGAVGDNSTDCTGAFEKAISACHQAGGGKVVVNPGQYLTGAIVLKSNVNLHLVHGSTIRFTRDTSRYPTVFTRWEGVELMNYSPFIYAFEQENIALTGKGTIDGNADCEHWWPWKGRKDCGWKPGGPSQENDRNRLFEMAEQGIPVEQRVFGQGHYLRPNFIQPYRCKNVLIEDVTLYNSPMWQIHPVLCTNVTVRGLTISSNGPNTDGCDPESCTDVLIENCFFDTGDDCIAVNSGRNADARRVNVPCRNVIVRNCRMQTGHGGVSLGSQCTGGISNVFVENCEMGSRDLWFAIRIKNNAMRGGVVEKIYVRDIDVKAVTTAGVAIDFFYEEGKKGKFSPVARTVYIRNLKTKKSEYALYLRGFKNAPIEEIHLTDCEFNNVAKPNVLENVKDLSLKNVSINGKLLSQPA
jgi:polygalacturonase